VINNTKIINSSSKKYGGGMALGLENTNINITYCEFIDNYSDKGGAIYFNKKNSNISFVGNLFQNNSAEVHGGACYFNEANDNILFIDEDSFKSIIVFDRSIPSGEVSFKKRFFHDNVSLVLFKFDPTSSDLFNIDIKVDNETIYNDLMSKSRVYYGVSSPPLLLQPNLIHISIVSKFDNFINVKFYLFPVLIFLNGSKNIFVNNTAIGGGGGAIYFNNNNSAGTSYSSQFSTLDIAGGTITISQGSSTAIYSGTSADYSSSGTYLQLVVNRSAQMIQSASTPFVSGTSINVVVS
jgi:hypothetical protein